MQLKNSNEDQNLNHVFQKISDIIGVEILFLTSHISVANKRIYP